MSSSLTSKPCQQLSRLLLISPNMCSSWSTTGNRTRSSSAPPDRVLRHCALTGCVSIDSSAIQTEKLPLSIGFCDSSSNKFFTHPTPLPLADVNSSEQRFVLPFQKTSLLPNYSCGNQKAAAAVPTRGAMHRLAHCLSTRSSSLLQLTPPNAHHFAIITLPSVTHFHSTSGNGEQSQTAAQNEAHSSSSKTVQIPVTFDHGHFKLYFFDRYEAILHYWQPIEALFETLRLEILPNAKWERVGTDLKQVQKFRIYNQEEFKEPSSSSSDSASSSASASTDTNPASASAVKLPPSSLPPTQHFRLAPTMPFGYLFVALNPSRVQLNGYSSEKGQGPVIFQFKLNAETLKRIVEWSQKNSVVSSGVSGASSMVPAKAATFARHELLFLEQEKYNLRTKFEPMQVEFNRLVSYAKVDAHRRFKLGGLFLLSAQLGFVGRLTWFEYSWDIMEPVTFCLTYSMMVATFAYYIVTSEEYVLPAVERRMVIKKFWKLVKSENFDVRQYRMMRDELTSLEKQIRALRKENFV